MSGYLCSHLCHFHVYIFIEWELFRLVLLFLCVAVTSAKTHWIGIHCKLSWDGEKILPSFDNSIYNWRQCVIKKASHIRFMCCIWLLLPHLDELFFKMHRQTLPETWLNFAYEYCAVRNIQHTFEYRKKENEHACDKLYAEFITIYTHFISSFFFRFVSVSDVFVCLVIHKSMQTSAFTLCSICMFSVWIFIYK